jgi:hypothetical protein
MLAVPESIGSGFVKRSFAGERPVFKVDGRFLTQTVEIGAVMDDRVLVVSCGLATICKQRSNRSKV